MNEHSQYLFRGRKSDNEEWVKGLPNQFISRAIIMTGVKISGDSTSETLDVKYEYVDQETVGRFAQEFDKKNNPVFEGDVLQSEIGKLELVNGELKRTGEIVRAGAVKWGKFSYSHCNEYDCTRTGYYIDFKEGCNTGIPLDIAVDEGYTVVGNIYDNPELLKQ